MGNVVPVWSTCPTTTDGTGNYNFTSSGFGTPTGCIVIVGNANTTNNPQSDIILSYGVSDLTNDRCIGTASMEGGSMATGRHMRDDAVVYMADDANNVQLKATVSSTTTDGVTLNFGTVAASYARYICVILIKGTTNIKALTHQMASGTNDITTIGFKPTLVNILCTGDSGAPPRGGITHAIAGIGWAHNSSTDTVTQAATHILGSSDGGPDDKVCALVTNSYCTGQVYDDAISWQASASAFDTSGLTLTTTANPGGDYVLMLAMEWADDDDVDIAILDSPTATGTYSTTAHGFTPECAILTQTMCSALDSLVTAQIGGAWSIGVFDDTNEGSIGIVSEDAAATINNEVYYNASNAINLQKWGGSSFDTMYQGSFTSFDANGYTFNIGTEADSTARKWVSVAFKAAAGGVSISPSQGNLTLSSSAPTLTLTTNANISPSQGDLVFSSVAPSVTVTTGSDYDITPAQGNLSLTTSAPTVQIDSAGAITVPQGNLTLSTTAPTVTWTTNADITPNQGNLTITTSAPSVTLTSGIQVQPPQGNLAFTTAAPTIGITTNASISPAQGNLTLSSTAPDITVTGVDIWTVQTPTSTTWSVQSATSTTWTIQ